MKNALFVETLLEIGFHTLSLINSTYPSTIWDKSSASYARSLAKNSVSGTYTLFSVYSRNISHTKVCNKLCRMSSRVQISTISNLNSRITKILYKIFRILGNLEFTVFTKGCVLGGLEDDETLIFLFNSSNKC